MVLLCTYRVLTLSSVNVTACMISIHRCVCHGAILSRQLCPLYTSIQFLYLIIKWDDWKFNKRCTLASLCIFIELISSNNKDYVMCLYNFYDVMLLNWQAGGNVLSWGQVRGWSVKLIWYAWLILVYLVTRKHKTNIPSTHIITCNFC